MATKSAAQCSASEGVSPPLPGPFQARRTIPPFDDTRPPGEDSPSFMRENRRDPFGIVGTTIDRRYEVRRVVAEGGFGVVYEAEAIALGVKVAIKVLRAEAVSSSPDCPCCVR